ncbi:hypothetical protein KP509_29G056600 [Ceratopteris richardii]|uniref:Uncharacterized protein n=1 Tax=Ceratopteris richardii TaxID=49495 RepID=A0A8T2R8J5_CERRI|nr:hypothetical protein KP509_29G056600 [Ceratopteris richardii]
MPNLRGRPAKSLNGKVNPYSQRGLDRFAAISAELKSAREKVAEELGTPVELVRFSSAPDKGAWVPVVIPQTSSKSERQVIKEAASELITRRKITENFKQRAVRLSEDDYNDDMLYEGSHGSDIHSLHDKKLPNERPIVEKSSTVNKYSHVDFGEIYKKCVLHCVMVPSKGLIWLMRFILFSLKICSCVSAHLLGWHDSERVSRQPHTQSTLKEDATTPDHQTELRASLGSSGCSTSTKQVHSSCLPLRTSVAEHKLIKSASASCSPKFPLQQRKASGSPTGHPGTAPLQRNINQVSSVARNHSTQWMLAEVISSGKPLSKSHLRSVSDPPKHYDTQILGQALTIMGFVIILSGLMFSYFVSIISVVCWWYLFSRMRRSIGDKPSVRRSHPHGHAQNKRQDANNAIISMKGKGKRTPNTPINNKAVGIPTKEHNNRRAVNERWLERRNCDHVLS